MLLQSSDHTYMGESFQDYSTESHPQNAELWRLF